MKKAVSLLALTLLIAMAGTAAADNLVFDLSPTNGITFRSSDSGPGQGVIVSGNITISEMAMYLNMPNGGDLKYMIWGNNDTTLLFSQVLTESASQSPNWVLSNPFSFTLQAGQEYWFGVIADNNIDVGYIFPPVPYSNGPLSADQSGNTNYVDYLNPAPSGGGAAEIGLQLYSSGTGTTPEPGTLILLGSGLLGAMGVARRRFRS